MKIPLHDYMDENNQYHVLFDECRRAVQLDPNERVINIERVRELVEQLEAHYLFTTMEELKKELGL